MKLTKQRLKEIIKEEILTEKLKRFKVYVSGEKEPLILMGKNEKEVKQTAYAMIRNSSVKVRKVVREGKLNETKFIAFYKSKKVTINAKSLYDAKKQIIDKLKVPKKDYGIVSVLNKTEYDKQQFRFEGKLNEKNMDKRVDTKLIAKMMMAKYRTITGKAWAKEILKKYPKGISQSELLIELENLYHGFGAGISNLFKGLND
tara:strand:- start:18 stop:623 length:606 start_codon:yes stop_codon:yes gene_type:complete